MVVPLQYSDRRNGKGRDLARDSSHSRSLSVMKDPRADRRSRFRGTGALRPCSLRWASSARRAAPRRPRKRATPAPRSLVSSLFGLQEIRSSAKRRSSKVAAPSRGRGPASRAGADIGAGPMEETPRSGVCGRMRRREECSPSTPPRQPILNEQHAASFGRTLIVRRLGALRRRRAIMRDRWAARADELIRAATAG